ncbi:MAG TPA: hypothetical protein VMU39_26495 [Solirubrobacteraceae bacterium]|nr:hypothetical protein [Solirubrobacteraceae bacterium]
MDAEQRLQIHQYNDPEILEFFATHGVDYRLVGDHLFIIRSRRSEVAAGPGDWLVAATDGAIEIERGCDERRALTAIARARSARRERVLA